MLPAFRALIDRILRREGGDRATNDPADSGGRTRFGISEQANPEAWADGIVTRAEAQGIYYDRYILAEKFDRIADPWLREQVVDFGVTSGPDTACRLLQKVVGAKIDGSLGAQTIAAIDAFPDGVICGEPLPGRVLVTLAFAKARGEYYIRLAARRPKDIKWVWGWCVRTLAPLTMILSTLDTPAPFEDTTA